MTKRADIIWLEMVDSTNDEAKRHIYDIDNLSVLSARQQISGRGQRGNTWSSEAGKNLTFSVAIRFGYDGVEPLQAYDQFVISEITALSVVELLASHEINAQIKWPNDVYVGSDKICGILIENTLSGTDVRYSIVGVGLNVNQTSFDTSLPNPTSMAMISAHEYNLEDLLEEFLDIFKEYVRRYCNGKGGYGRLRKLYLSQLWRKGIPTGYIDHTATPPEEFTGCIRGLNDIGNLLVEKEEGELKEFAFKEISYKL